MAHVHEHTHTNVTFLHMPTEGLYAFLKSEVCRNPLLYPNYICVIGETNQLVQWSEWCVWSKDRGTITHEFGLVPKC